MVDEGSIPLISLIQVSRVKYFREHVRRHGHLEDKKQFYWDFFVREYFHLVDISRTSVHLFPAAII